MIKRKYANMRIDDYNIDFEDVENTITYSLSAKNLENNLNKREEKLCNKIADLEAKLAEKDKEIEKYRNANMIVLGVRSQGKKHFMQIKIKELQNQKALERLEKVKEFVNEIYGEYSASITTNFIDNQINELKEGK